MNKTKLLPVVAAALRRYDITYKVLACTPELADTVDFCEHYNIAFEQAANTLLVMSRKVEPVQYAVCVVLATTKVDVNKKVCALMHVKKASFADSETATQLTGMEMGGVTAVGVTTLPIYIDAAVLDQESVIMGGGNRSSKLLLDPKQLLKLPGALTVPALAILKD